jgi:uncharacterized membrane protein YdbT with pleckstrin-like domain
MEEFELETGESITLSVHKHWIILVGQELPYIVLAILPFFLPLAIWFIGTFNPATAADFNQSLAHAGPWFELALAFWWLFLWIGAFTVFTRYYLTMWIITTTRIVEIHQYGFFSRRVSSFLLNRIQDVTTDIEGLFPTLFSFGSLNVETAGREERFQMNGIQNPTELRDLIMREIAALHADGQLPASGV